MSVTIKLNYAGVGQLLRSAGVQADLNRRASAVARAVDSRGITVEDDAELLTATVEEAGSERARAIVALDHPAGLAAEVKYRVLGGALDAAR